MSTQLPFQSSPLDATPMPFPTRGVPGGWRDPWDDDPYEVEVAAIRQRNAVRRRITESGLPLELLARAQADGRWEARVAAAPAHWPAVNGPTAPFALDALEAELRELIRRMGTRPTPTR